jgi:hypothetical protein
MIVSALISDSPIPSSPSNPVPIRADALHVHPINKLVQLRPELGYLDDLDKKKRNEEARRKRRGGDDFSGSEDDEDVDDAPAGKNKKPGSDELKSVTVRRLLLS